MEKTSERPLSRLEQIEHDLDRLSLELEQLRIRASEGIRNPSGRHVESAEHVLDTIANVEKDIRFLQHERMRILNPSDETVGLRLTRDTLSTSQRITKIL